MILALIAAVLILAYSSLGTATVNMFNQLVSQL